MYKYLLASKSPRRKELLENIGMEFTVCESDFDESTIKTLFVVEGKNNEILIPAIEDFIESIDHENKEIVFDLPQGLISL